MTAVSERLLQYAENADFNGSPQADRDTAAFVGSEDGPMFRAVAKLVDAIAPLMDPENCSAFISAWELDSYNTSIDGEDIWKAAKAAYDEATEAIR